MTKTTIFDFMYPKYKIKTPIRLIELFAGYGSTKLAWNYLGINVESYKICEWAVKSIQAYKDIHFTDDNTDYSKELSVEEIKTYLFNKGISSNYNEPMTEKQINRLGEKQIRNIYNNIKATHNLVNVQTVKGSDLEIVDKDKYTYMLTYSFPCQDISNAGKGKGYKDSSTRSGMLWEVERILTELKESNSLPQCLLMENVPLVHGVDNIESWNKWQLRLEELGYKNYWQDLIATDYGIPQTRNRCFMVSILGDYSYTFPKPIPLKLKLKDLLEDNVPEKYFLSDKMINYIYSNENAGNYNRKAARESCDKSIEKGVACTITTTAGNRPTDNFIKTKCGSSTSARAGVVIRKCGIFDKENKKYQAGSIYDKEGSSPTLDTATGGYRTPYIQIKKNNLRIRKLTPKECFRLQGVRDKDYEKVAQNQSDSSLYHLAGDSIVVNVLMAIYKELIDENRD